jgi:D-sedoheptulose 7-phosphate isomerase
MDKKFIENYLNEMKKSLEGISVDKIYYAMEILFDAWKKENIIFVIGNGGSASTASHFAADLAKSTITENKKRFKVISLVDNVPLITAWTNDNGWDSVYEEQLKPWLKENDVLVVFSVHGGSGKGNAGLWSQNLVRAIRLAKERNAKVIGFTGFDGGIVKEMSDVCIVIPTNSEQLNTPLVESCHVALHHLIVFGLKEWIKNE